MPGERSRWLVMLDPNQRRPGVLDKKEKRVGEDAAQRSAQVVDAVSAREAAEGYRCSVWDLRVGMTLIVYRLGEPDGRFHREYAVKGDAHARADWTSWPSDPVTVER